MKPICIWIWIKFELNQFQFEFEFGCDGYDGYDGKSISKSVMMMMVLGAVFLRWFLNYND